MKTLSSLGMIHQGSPSSARPRGGRKGRKWRAANCALGEAAVVQLRRPDRARRETWAGKPKLWGTSTATWGSLSRVRRRLRSETGFGAKSEERGSHRLLGEERPPPEGAWATLAGYPAHVYPMSRRQGE